MVSNFEKQLNIFTNACKENDVSVMVYVKTNDGKDELFVSTQSTNDLLKALALKIQNQTKLCSFFNRLHLFINKPWRLKN